MFKTLYGQKFPKTAIVSCKAARRLLITSSWSPRRDPVAMFIASKCRLFHFFKGHVDLIFFASFPFLSKKNAAKMNLCYNSTLPNVILNLEGVSFSCGSPQLSTSQSFSIYLSGLRTSGAAGIVVHMSLGIDSSEVFIYT